MGQDKLPTRRRLPHIKIMKTLIVVPRWSGTPAHDWYPWIGTKLHGSSSYSPVVIADMPDPGLPTIDGWRQALAAIAGADPGALSSTVLVGHSVGAQAVLHFLAELPEGVQIASALFVAGWWSVDQPWESIRPWVNHSHAHARIRRAAKSLHVLISDNDPFTAGHAENAELWRSRLGATVRVVPGAKHFNGAEEPAVHAALERIAAEA